jgi:hypothetical protein
MSLLIVEFAELAYSKVAVPVVLVPLMVDANAPPDDPTIAPDPLITSRPVFSLVFLPLLHDPVIVVVPVLKIKKSPRWLPVPVARVPMFVLPVPLR